MLASMFGVIAFASYVASNPVLEMWLAKRHADAVGEAERQQLIAAGHVLVEQWVGTAFSVGYVLGGSSLTMISVVMLRDGRFGGVTASLGIVFGVLNLVPASAGKVGLVCSLASLVPMWIWLALVARRLARFARSNADAHALHPPCP